MSGKKGRSGRKPDTAVQTLRSIINQAVSQDDWVVIWAAVAEAAKKGNIQATRLLSENCFGGPKAQAPAFQGPTTMYYLPAREGQELPLGAVMAHDEPPDPPPAEARDSATEDTL